MPSPDDIKYIAIAGNIGVGKTTLTRLLSERFNWQAFYENFDENPYLVSFYEDMSRWAFQSQIFFLKERIKEHINIQQLQTSCVQDRTIYEDAEVFARNLYERGIMPERDFAVYYDLYSGLRDFLRSPDVLIYLRASAWTLISRIRKRGRDFEQQIDKEYIMQLNTLYESWVSDMQKTHRVLVIETDEFDIINDKAWRENVLQRISEEVAGV